MRPFLVLVLVLTAAAGCSGLGASVRPRTGFAAATEVDNATCISWLGSRRTWGAAALGTSGSAATAAGLSAVLPHDEGRTVALGIAGAAFAIFSAVATAVARGYAEDFGRFCVDEHRPADRPAPPR